MGLNFFFNRKAVFPKILLILGWGWSILMISKNSPSVLYLFFLAQAFLLTIVRFIPFYAKADRGWGIEEHFRKIIVIVGYVLLLTDAVLWAWPKAWLFLILPNVAFLFLNTVAALLIFFHFQDEDKTPPAFLSRSPFS